MRATLVACLFVTACTGTPGPQGEPGSKGDKGDPGEPGPPGSPDSAAEILAKLATVSLDADSLGGVPASEYVRRGPRQVNVSVSSVALYNSAVLYEAGGLGMPDSTHPSFEFSWVVPSDFEPGTTPKLVVVGWALSNVFPCEVDLRNNSVYTSRPGASGWPAFDASVLGETNELHQFPQAQTSALRRYRIQSAEPLQPGDALLISLYRVATATDTCDDNFYVTGIALEY